MTEVSQPMPDFLKLMAGSAARHVFSGLGGALVTAGAIQSDQLGQFVTIGSGVAVWGCGLLWSAVQKKFLAKQLLRSPP